MDIRETKSGDIIIFEPVGRLESKTSPELEKKLLEHMANGQRRFVIDFSAIEYLSSAGLRVLLMVGKKLSGDGYLALSGLNDRVREVFDIAGFTAVFVIRTTAGEAVASAPAPGGSGEKAADDAARLLGARKMARPPVDPEVVELAKRAAAALLGARTGGGESGAKARR